MQQFITYCQASFYKRSPANWPDRKGHISKGQVAKWAMGKSDTGMNRKPSI